MNNPQIWQVAAVLFVAYAVVLAGFYLAITRPIIARFKARWRTDDVESRLTALERKVQALERDLKAARSRTP